MIISIGLGSDLLEKRCPGANRLEENEMVIWNGLGFLVVVIVFILLLAAEYVTEWMFADDSYYQAQGWPKLVAFFIAAAMLWPLGIYLNRKEGKVLIEKATGKEILIKPNHSLFFIRMEYWGPILLILGVIFFFV